MLLILIKDLVKKGHSAVLKNLTSLVAQARPQAFSLFSAGAGNLTARELRSNLVPSSVLHAATGIGYERTQGTRLASLAL